jgi:pimeloyl-ACP methyl ester carboxylesterase
MKNKRSKLRRFLKVCGLGCGTSLFLLIVLIYWIYLAVFAGPDLMDLNSFHPFRSEKAKQEYLAHYDMRAREWPVESENRLVQTSFGETFVRISGPPDAPPLVLLPGGGATSLIWRPNIEAFSERYRTYAVDNIYDFGRSRFNQKMTTAQDSVAWLDEFFGALELGDRINLIGYSYGGWLASEYTLAHGERLDRVVLVAPAATIRMFGGDFMWRSVVCLIPLRTFTRRTMYWVWADLVQHGDDGRQIAEDRVDDVMLAFRSFKFKVPAHPRVLSDDELAGITTPVLFLVGENEKIYPAGAVTARLQRVAPQIKTEVFPGTGHDLTFLRTEQVNASVLAFLADSDTVPEAGASQAEQTGAVILQM